MCGAGWGVGACTCNCCLYFLQRSSRSLSFRSPGPPRPSGTRGFLCGISLAAMATQIGFPPETVLKDRSQTCVIEFQKVHNGMQRYTMVCRDIQYAEA